MSEELMAMIESLVQEHYGTQGLEYLRQRTRPAPEQVPQGMRQTAYDLLACFRAWEPDVRILGNVRAEDAGNLIEAMLTAAPSAPVACESGAQECDCGPLEYCTVCAKSAFTLSSKKPVAQGGGVDVEKVMALVEEYGEAKWSQGDSQYRRGCQSSADYYSEDAGRIRDRIRALLSASPAGVGGWQPVEGDLLPPVGSKVLIHLASLDEWVERTVTGYYVWGDLGGSKHLHRVFVRVVSESGYPNARMLHEVRPLPAAPAIANQEPQA